MSDRLPKASLLTNPRLSVAQSLIHTAAFLLSALAVAVLWVSPASADPADFPRPAELEPDINFWRSIFTEYSTDEGALHDNRNLGIVYERLPMPSTLSRRERNRRVAARRKVYRAVLESLGTGKRSGLTADEQRVLELWGANTGNQEFVAAAGRIRFQQGLSDRFADSIRRSGRWRQHIEAVLSANGVPLELAALPHVESSYNPAARSHVGASGIWQFTRSTGRRFMQVDHVVDGRNDPFVASDAAARLLAYNYSLTGNWPMAITAYNHGLAGARRAMRQHGDEAYVDILRNYRGRTFGFASRNFYVAFLAAMDVDQDPQRYFPGVDRDAPADDVTFTLSEFVAADTLADALGIDRREFLRFNPGLQPTVAEGSKYVPRDLELRLPRGRVSGDIAARIAAIDPADRFAAQLPDMFHTIRRGDTLSEIAAEYATSVRTLVALNNLGSRHRIRAGQRLRLPAAGPAPAAPEPMPEPVVTATDTVVASTSEALESQPAALETGDPAAEAVIELDTTVATEAADANTPMDSLEAALISDPSDYSVAEDQTIEVHPQETLGHYADWLGTRTQRLRDLNGFAFRRPVVVGERIELDLGTTSVAEFERRRAAYHKTLQDAFFREYRISGVTEHPLADGESLWVLSHRHYGVPVWLLRQYNPEIDMNRVRAGTRVRFPVLDANAE